MSIDTRLLSQAVPNTLVVDQTHFGVATCLDVFQSPQTTYPTLNELYQAVRQRYGLASDTCRSKLAVLATHFLETQHAHSIALSSNQNTYKSLQSSTQYDSRI
jgi:hypothetical protein